MGSLDWAPIACTSILLLSGCAQILGIDDNVGAKSEVADAASIPDATTDAASTPDAGLPFCVDNTIPVGTSNVNTELGGTDDFAPSCTSGTGNDQAFLWKAPVTDYYVFDTVGSNFDTVLALQTTCEANSEIACNNNRGAESISELVRKVEANDALVVIVDGFAGSQGVGKVNIERVSCPDEDLEGQTGFPLVQTTINAGDDNTSVCGGAGFPDRAYHWVVPEDGLWAFNATAAGFATTIAVQDGPRCQDELLGCSTSSGPELHSEVVRRLQANQIVSVIVDGADGEGAYDLDISKREATCPEDAIALGALDTLQLPITSYTGRILAPSCAVSEIFNGVSTKSSLNDYSYAFTMAANTDPSCSYSCSFFIHSDDAFAASLLDQNDCGGSEVACVVAQPTDGFRATLYVNSSDVNVDRTIIVSAMSDMATTFSILVECQGICSVQ